MRRRFAVPVVSLMFAVICATMSMAAPSGFVGIDRVEGKLVGDTGTFSFRMRVVVDAPDSVSGLSNGFRIYSPDGAGWSNLVATASSAVKYPFETYFFTNVFSNGVSPDTVGFAGFSTAAPHMFPTDYNINSFVVSLRVNRSDTGKSICIDSSGFAPSNTWKWVSPGGATGVPSWGGAYCFQIWYDSTFTMSTPITGAPLYFKVYDVDRDNNVDLVYGGQTDGANIAYGQPGGNFDTPVHFVDPTEFVPSAVAVDFVTTDTLPDIIFVTWSGIYVYVNNGGRSYTLTTSAHSSAEIIPSTATGYFNSDRYLDLIANDGDLYFGDGTGAFTPAAFGVQFKAADVGDFNRDGIDDIVAGHNGYSYIWLNDGSANFTKSDSLFTGDTPSGISTGNGVADFNHDGHVDFAAISYLGFVPGQKSQVTVVFGNGSGKISGSFSTFVPGYAFTPVIADVNRDRHLDVVTSNGSTPDGLYAFYGDGLGNFPRLGITYYPAGPTLRLSLGSGDFDRDGNPDFVTGSFYPGGAMVRLLNSALDAPVQIDQMTVTGYTFPPAGLRFDPAQKSGGTALTAVSLEVYNPQGFLISQEARTVGGSYYMRLDADQSGTLDERTLDLNLLKGEYRIVIRRRLNSLPGTTFGIGVGIDGSLQATIFNDYGGAFAALLSGPAMDSLSDSIVFYYTFEPTPSMQPANGIQTFSLRPTFDWHKLVDLTSTKYHFQLDKYFDERAPIYNDSNRLTTNFVPPSPLGKDSVYYWRVRSYKGGAWSDWSRTMAAYIGAPCCVAMTGNVDCDPGNGVDISDLSRLVDYLYISFLPLCCKAEANIDGSADGNIDISDLSALVDYLYVSFTPPKACQ